MKSLIMLALLGARTSQAGTIEGRVVNVADGDTITVLDTNRLQHKIRLGGIDAPEKKQSFGSRSKQSLSELVFSKVVKVETGKTDRYVREVGKVIVDGIDANLEQMQRGVAWHYKAYQREQSASDRQLYGEAEIAARAAGRGLWRDVAPIPPWEFRHKENR
jgi:endonuclease YncB( thermonuclease family)